MARNPGRQGKYNISDVKHPGRPGKFQGYGSDSSHDTKDIIYFGEAFNATIVAFKGFVSDIKYDVQKKSEVVDKQETKTSVFDSYSGNIGIKLTFDVPAHSRNEAKNNLAKISHLQTAIREPRNQDEGTAYHTQVYRSYVFVYFKNLINNGNLAAGRSINDFDDLSEIGLPCVIKEIKYEPDFDAGFHDLKGEIFAKNYKLNLTLDPITVTKLSPFYKYFFHPFNDTGQYNGLTQLVFHFY